MSELVKRPAEDILSYELTLYPVEGGTTFGRYDEFISSPRIDNLTSCVACLEGIFEAKAMDAEGLRMVVLFDNEEVGSRTNKAGLLQFCHNWLSVFIWRPVIQKRNAMPI